ncbi:MAG: hypothetical protein GXP59_10020 [Deltaproteobacteria bacterium]|nr:hypothetical protein [Deltaproteobacteria bacterium]
MENISREVDRLLRAGRDKKQVWRLLRSDDNEAQLAFCLNNTPLPDDRVTYRYINYFLSLALLVMTIDKTWAAVSFGRFDLYFFASLVVPTINVYILFEVWNFRRRGYQFLFVLSCLALIRPENYAALPLIMLAVQISLAAFLFLRIFPVQRKITIEKK